MQLLIKPITRAYVKKGYVTIAHLKSIKGAFGNVCQSVFLKNSNLFFLLKINFFLYVLIRFDVLILKIIFKK